MQEFPCVNEKKKVFNPLVLNIFMKVPYDVVGDIAIFKFSRWWVYPFKKIFCSKFLKKNKNIQVCLDKAGKFEGVLRVQKTRFLAGDNRKETVHKENGCRFFLDIDKAYFSSRLSSERKLVAEEIFKKIVKAKKKNPKILVMFSGIAPQAIVLAKLLKHNKINAKIVCVELNKDACEFAKRNVYMNNLKNYIEIVEGDVKNFCQDAAKKRQKFDFILMLRPNLEDMFLEDAFKVSGKATSFYYHGFGEGELVRKETLGEIKRLKKKVKIFKMRKAGDIAVKKFRWNISFSQN